MVRDAFGVSKKKQVYYKVYGFASSVCSNISAKSKPHLLRQWEWLKRSENRRKKRKNEVNLGPASSIERVRASSELSAEPDDERTPSAESALDTRTQAAELPSIEESNVNSPSYAPISAPTIGMLEPAIYLPSTAVPPPCCLPHRKRCLF
ncbi:hypothetical protein F441_00417 [Phytophthora nicotianae CJ01A1]|uniref:Uncharacterized protein n=1 Tax=Phytophthora nicotianae CJ01A1 TaxID=1317063 RepID=W2XVX1_PHYNI|nr:hypothetical protein F441_00417 [Phytophthora nicotianae CJ01A1]